MVIVWNAAIVSIAMVWSMSYTGGFDPVAGFPPTRLSLAVLRSSHVVLDAHSVSSLLWSAREGASLDQFGSS